VDGRWIGIIDLGWQDGKRQRKYLYGRTRAEVADKLARARADHQAGQLIADERITVQQFLDTWLETLSRASGRACRLQLHRVLHHAPRRQTPQADGHRPLRVGQG
jgi:integrase